MNYICTLPQNIHHHESIILPISMNQPLEQGERLASILKAVEEYGYKNQLTILICDFLNRHNCNEKKSIEQGDLFIAEYQDLLKSYKLLRWKDFLNQIDQHKFAESYQLLTEKSPEGSRFYNKIKKTWEKCLSSTQKLEASIKYQIEEYAAILCMKGFNHLFYPRRITNGMAYLYHYFEGEKPIYHHIKISEKKDKLINQIEKSDDFFIGRVQSKQHMHIAFRSVLEQINILLSSSELSDKSKRSFAEELENLLMMHRLLNIQE